MNKMEEPRPFQIRPYGCQELALLYNPGVSPNAAIKRFRKWMYFNQELIRELQEAGWRKGNRLFSPMEVKILVRYFGEP